MAKKGEKCREDRVDHIGKYLPTVLSLLSAAIEALGVVLDEVFVVLVVAMLLLEPVPLSTLAL